MVKHLIKRALRRNERVLWQKSQGARFGVGLSGDALKKGFELPTMPLLVLTAHSIYLLVDI